MASEQQLPGDVAWRESRWFRLGRWWGRTHYVLGISAVIAPIVASTAEKGSLQVAMTVLAAVCGGVAHICTAEIARRVLIGVPRFSRFSRSGAFADRIHPFSSRLEGVLR